MPRDVFVDPYELTQRQHDNIGPDFKLWGETDLELPTSAVSEGSLALLGPVESGITVDLPFHARYPLPSVNDTHVTLKLKEPSLLTICDSKGPSNVTYWCCPSSPPQMLATPNTETFFPLTTFPSTRKQSLQYNHAAQEKV